MHCKFIISLIALLSIKQIDSTCTSKFPIYGIQIDVPFSVFSGLKIAYQQPYTDPTASGILQGIKDSCTENSVACVGCCLSGQNVVHVLFLVKFQMLSDQYKVAGMQFLIQRTHLMKHLFEYHILKILKFPIYQYSNRCSI